MIEITNPPPVDRTGWDSGPWDSEPDRHEWTTLVGMPGLINRNRMGVWCGYAALNPDHPLHGITYAKVHERMDLDVHGGLTYSEFCGGHICHVPKPGEPDNVWWLGFDCGHAMDLNPGMRAYYKKWEEEHGEPLPSAKYGMFQEHYRTMEYAMREVENLAKQLKEYHDSNR